MNAYPIGNDLTVKWSLLYSDGSVFPLSNYDYEFSYRTNRGHKIVTDTSVISVEENILTWTFKGDEQVVSGRYTLCLKITLSGSKVIELQYDNAFMLSPLSGFKGAGSEIVIQSYCDAIDLKDAVLQARKAMDLAADAVIDTAKSAEDAKAAKAAAEVTAAQAKNDATSAVAMAIEASGKVAVAEQAATDASRDAAASQQAAQTASDHITSLEQAIAELPDGQAVSEKVAEHTIKLTELEGAKHIVTERGKNLFSGENVDGYLKNSSGEIGVAGDWKTSDFIDISNIAKVVFSGGAAEDSTARMAAFWLLAYDADKIPIASSYNGGTGVFYFDNLYGASYLRISYHGTNINYVQVESGNYVTSYEPYRIVTTLLQSNYIRKEEVKVLENIKQIVDKNLIDSSKSVTGYIKNNSGTIDIAGDWMTTDFIDVSTLSDIVFTSVQSDQIRHINDMYFLLGYDNDKSPIASTYATTIHTPYSIPDGVSYIRFAYHRNTESDLQLEAGRVPTTYEPYKVVTLLESSDYQRMGSLWRGKKWCVVGDSLTEKNIRATKHYYDYVQEVTGISVENKGASGTGYARTDNKFYTRISSISADVDVITIFGSGNDAGADLPIGEPEDTALTSLCGYINKCIDEVQRLFPLVPFGIVTPTPWNGGEPNDPTSAWFTNYSKAIVDICALRGVPCLDLYHCSNLHPSNKEFRRLAYSRDADGVDGNPNGTHPDENGHKIIAPRFKAFLETLLI